MGPGKRTDAIHMRKKSLIKVTYNNYFSCLTCIKDNFIMNKHYFTFRSVRPWTITASLAEMFRRLYANFRQKQPRYTGLSNL